MTVIEILEELKPFKPMRRETLYLHMRKMKIRPLGVRQKPVHYPEDTGRRLLLRFGFKAPTNGKAKRTNCNGRQLTRA